jgi:A/G-specific adenine glycosylase
MAPPDAPETAPSAEANDLLAWYERERRDLAWRRTSDPYRVWVSEIMLQQTQVERVEPYFRRFIARFPTVESLAEAPLSEVLALWSGLGYYRRARHLHAAARSLQTSPALPDSARDWQRLPGVGPYTAAAIASIALGENVPAIDANVERVVARFGAIGDSRTAEGRRRLLEVARTLLDPGRPGDGNQALMDLGATVCTKAKPRCAACPLAGGCRALELGQVADFPRPLRRTSRVHERRLSVVVERSGRVLLVRRPDDADLLAGLWEVPWVVRRTGEAPEIALTSKYGGRWRLEARRGAVRHAITYRDLEIEVWSAGLEGSSVGEGVVGGWYDERERAALAMPSWVGKALGRCASAAGPR